MTGPSSFDAAAELSARPLLVGLEQKVDPTITAIATMLIVLSTVTLVVVALLVRKAGLLASRAS